MPNFIEIGVGSRKFSKKLVDLTRNDPEVKEDKACGPDGIHPKLLKECAEIIAIPCAC